MTEILVLVRRSEGRQEKLTLEIKDDRCYVQTNVAGVDATSFFGIERLPERLVDLFNDRWHPANGGIGVSTRYAIGEAVKEGFSTEDIGKMLFRSTAEGLVLKGRSIAYAKRTTQSLAREGDTNRRWNDRDLASLDTDLIGRFLGTLREVVTA